MKYVIFLAILILLIMAFAAPGPASGQVLYPATGYPAFTAAPIYEAYPAYTMPKPTLIPTAPPDFGFVVYDPTRVKNFYVHVVTSTQAVEERVEPMLAPISYRQTVCMRYLGVCAQRRIGLTTWIAE